LILPHDANGIFYVENEISVIRENFPSIQILEDSIEYESFNPSLQYHMSPSKLIYKTIDSEQKIAVICTKYNKSSCEEDTNDRIKMFLDKKENRNLKSKVQQEREKYQAIFNRLDMKKSSKSLLSALWYSSLPCFDVKNVTSERVGEAALLKYCEWQGQKVPCSAIFTKFPTDQGLCCAFNMEAADATLNEVTYSKLISDLQKSDLKLALESKKNFNRKILTSQSGIAKGLKVILDAHTDILGSSSFPADLKGFRGFISSNRSYPRVYHKGFQIRAGHNNLVAVSATMVEASPDIRHIEPARRRCLFSDETENLKIYKKYSQSDCYFECSLQNAKNELLKKNISCTPWIFPTHEQIPTFCEPWENMAFFRALHKTPGVNFINVLRTAFTLVGPKSVKRY